MSSAITDFLGALKGGGARPNRFEVIIDLPTPIGDALRQIPLLCQSTSLPGSNLGIAEAAFRGRQVKLAGDRTFDDWEVTFYTDIDFGIRNSLEAWSNIINQYNSNTAIASAPIDYMSTCEVHQLDNQDNRVKSYTMLFAFPTVVGPSDLAQDSNDQIEIFPATFAFSDIINGVNS